MPNASDPPPPDSGGQSGSSGIPRSGHARLRSGQGRPISQVVNDVQRAGPKDVFVQPDDGRFVVRGGRGREHIIEADGEHLTSVYRSDAANQLRLQNGVIRAATDEEYQKLKGFVA